MDARRHPRLRHKRMPGAAESRVGDGLSAGGMVAGIDSLRRLAADVLTYDISGIPDESADETEAYRQDVLSKMSHNDLIRCILLQPTVKLSRTDSNTGLLHPRPEHHHAARPRHLPHELQPACPGDQHHLALL